jgi:hypothetical protein
VCGRDSWLPIGSKNNSLLALGHDTIHGEVVFTVQIGCVCQPGRQNRTKKQTKKLQRDYKFRIINRECEV